MKNSEQPIMPFFLEKGIVHPYQLFGLTKREYFTAMAMQGLISNAPNGHLSNTKEGVQLALSWADETLKQLEEAK
jgi:hypothetical protein